MWSTDQRGYMSRFVDPWRSALHGAAIALRDRILVSPIGSSLPFAGAPGAVRGVALR